MRSGTNSLGAYQYRTPTSAHPQKIYTRRRAVLILFELIYRQIFFCTDPCLSDFWSIRHPLRGEAKKHADGLKQTV